MRYRSPKFLIRFLIAIIAVATAGDAIAKKRTSQDVKRDKQRTEKQIAQTKKQIAANDRETGLQLDRLNSIKADMALRADTIKELSARLDSVNQVISKMNDSIAALEARRAQLKNTYARTLRTIRARRQSMSDMAFIFAAGSFSEAWRRARYLNEVAKSSTKQARSLAVAQDELADARAALEKTRAEQAAVLAHHTAAQNALRTEQASADALVKNLKRQGKSLQRELDRRNKQAKSLAAELDKIVEQEIREAEERRRREAAEAERRRREAEAKAKAEAEARAKAEAEAKKGKKTDDGKPSPAKSQKPESPKSESKPQKPEPNKQSPQFESEAEKDRRLSGSFASNKGRLLFPVAGKYSIVSNFGTNEIPELSKVKVDNLGIDIEVPRGTSARSVFEGVVSSIFRLDGYNNIVIVRHGEYLSVYAGIDALKVKKGDKVTAGQNLGTIFTPRGGERSRLHFEIRHEKQKLNPTEWVK